MLKEGEIRIPSGCAISGIFNKKGKPINGQSIIDSIATMHDRSNGLGGGFAGYGIYPQYKDAYAFHVFYDDTDAKIRCEKFLDTHFDVINLSKIPTKKVPSITNEPLIMRYFLNPLPNRLRECQLEEEEYTAQCVIRINNYIDGAYVFSSGKNMGVFKAVGFPEDVGEFYRLDEYDGYCWTAHGRYPTNTPGWWGGAHPFALLDYSIVHNGEISSYDANRRFIEMFGYKCTLLTDTEVITYIIDYLNRKQGLTLNEVSDIIAAPFWDTIDSMEPSKREKFMYLRNAFSSLLITGPFSILLGFKGDTVYAASEECAIRVIQPDLDKIWSPKGGEAFIVTLEEEIK